MWWNKKTEIFFGSGCRSFLAQIFLVNVCEWLKREEVIDWSAKVVGDSKTVSVSERSNKSGSLLNDRNFDNLGVKWNISENDRDP